MGGMSGFLDWLMSIRVIQQSTALFSKNALVAWRNRKATLLRLLAPFLFLLLALLIDVATKADDSSKSAYADVQNPDAVAVGPIPSCHDDLYIGGKDCNELLYTPDTIVTRVCALGIEGNNRDLPSRTLLDSHIVAPANPSRLHARLGLHLQAIMGNVTSRNGVRITAIAHATSDSIQKYLLDYPDSILAAVHFVFNGDPAVGSSLAGFKLQTNTTSKFFKDTYQDPNLFVQLPTQSAVQREISRYFMAPAFQAAADNLNWSFGVKNFAHPSVATRSVLGMVLGPFVFAACMFSFVAQINILVGEKELGLRQALRTMGMTDFSYWLSWAAWELVLAFITGHLITWFGLLMQFQLFLKNSYGILFFLFFLFQLAMSSLAMLVCTLMHKTSVAVYFGFAVFLLGWIMQTVVVFGVPYTPDFYNIGGGAVTVIFSIFPWDPLAKGFNDLGSATISDTAPGIKWSERSSYCQNIPYLADRPVYNPREQYLDFACVFPLTQIYNVYIALWLGYLVLAIYLDNILPNEIGVRRPFYYPLMPSYWFPSYFTRTHSMHDIDDSMGPRPQATASAPDSDVVEEESRMRGLLQGRTGRGEDKPAAPAAVEVFGLKKVFPHNPCGPTLSCCCASTRDDRAFWAIKNSWFKIEENQLFCLLGPNGAGKSTTINCLTGVLPASNGEALVYGNPISSTGSMERIRSMMGVCPQFDVLWGELNGAEHLRIYGHVKGIHWRDVASQGEQLLEKVKLTYAATQRSSVYSGGMKRRLSVAIALLGDPKVVYLDEPTTGMDPISRRYVWDIIQEAKEGRAIVLTTHSMEEADILGDRIAIMAKGKLRCIGTSLRLKQKFGSGYQVAVSVVPTLSGTIDAELVARRSEAVKAYFSEQLGLEPFEEGRVYMHFLVPRDKEEQLSPFLKQLEAKSKDMGITDVQLSMTSLEEVFLNIAKSAELEEAKGGAPVDVVLPDGTTIKVPLGEEYVVHPATTQCYKVRWGVADESGQLCALECIPVDPAQVQAHHQAKAGAAAPASGLPVAQPVAGACDVALPDGTVLRVPADQRYVLNPVNNTPYEITWGRSAAGAPVVLQCKPYVSGQQPPRDGDGRPGSAPRPSSAIRSSNRVHPVAPVNIDS